MTPGELRERLSGPKATVEKLPMDFWFSTGCTLSFLVTLSDDDLMQLWARFVMERIEEVTK